MPLERDKVQSGWAKEVPDRLSSRVEFRLPLFTYTSTAVRLSVEKVQGLSFAVWELAGSWGEGTHASLKLLGAYH